MALAGLLLRRAALPRSSAMMKTMLGFEFRCLSNADGTRVPRSSSCLRTRSSRTPSAELP